LISMVNVGKYTSPMDPIGQVCFRKLSRTTKPEGHLQPSTVRSVHGTGTFTFTYMKTYETKPPFMYSKYTRQSHGSVMGKTKHHLKTTTNAEASGKGVCFSRSMKSDPVRNAHPYKGFMMAS